LEGIEDMKKLFILESKGEIMAMLSHDEKSYIEFKSEIEEITKEGNTDFHTVKGILTSLYGYELMEIVASAEVTKRKGGF
jgi:hypothetical protein